MGTTIAPISVPPSGPSVAVNIDTALQAQVTSAQVKNVEMLFGSLGLGTNTNATA